MYIIANLGFDLCEAHGGEMYILKMGAVSLCHKYIYLVCQVTIDGSTCDSYYWFINQMAAPTSYSQSWVQGNIKITWLTSDLTPEQENNLDTFNKLLSYIYPRA